MGELLEMLGITGGKLVLQIILWGLWAFTSWLAVRRVKAQKDLNSGTRTGLIILAIVLPFLGPLIVLLYILTKPRPSSQSA